MQVPFLSFLILFSGAAFADNGFSQRDLQVAPTDYTFHYHVETAKKTLSASGVITVKNVSPRNASHIPLRLNRLLTVSRVADSSGNPLSFTQQVLSNDNWPEMKTNYVEIKLNSPLKAGETIPLGISFSGSIASYEDTGMSYVKDRVSDAFTIIRMDAFAYPVLTYPNDVVNRKSKFWLNTYDYNMTFTISSDSKVANGGQLVEVKGGNDSTSFQYINKLPAWRMDFAIADYTLYKKGSYSVYSWESEELSLRLLRKIRETFRLYQEWFGPLQRELGYTFIEVPANYGAQADVTAVIQDEAGFHEFDRVYHEISHQWNVKSLEEYSPRWNEGLATFLAALTSDVLDGGENLNKKTNENLQFLRDLFHENPRYLETPFLEYGEEGLSSYRLGMIFFRLLYDLTGQILFNEIIGGFYQSFYESGATSEDFIRYAKSKSSVSLESFFYDWAYTSEYGEKIIGCSSYEELRKHYM